MIGVAVAGAGHWGPNLIANFERSDRSQVLHVIDADAARLEVVRNRFPKAQISSTLKSALEDDAVQALVISTSTASHFELARLALEAGKHVLVEKPMTDSAESSRILCELAQTSQRVLMVGHVFVYNAASLHVKEYLKQGALGEIHYLSMVRTNLGPIRVDVDAAWDLAAHDIALANFWLDAEPESVSASGGSYINEGIADVIFATLRYPGGILVHLHASWLNPRKARDITIVGERRMLTFDDLDVSEPLRLYDKRVGEPLRGPALVDSIDSFRTSVRVGDITVPRVESQEPLMSECDHFLDCILEGKTPRSGGSEGLAVVRALEALSRSREAGGRETSVESR